MKDQKYLTIKQNGKTKTIQNGWLILRDEMKIDRAFLLKCFERKVPNLAAWNIARTARKKKNPKNYALYLLKRLVGTGMVDGVKVPQTERNAPNSRDNYSDPFKT